MRRHRYAKIVATVGPATNTPEMLKALFLAGVDTFRLNFSHGVQADHARVHAAIRALEAEVGRPIGILQDLQGPKIRVGTVRDGRLDLTAGERVRFVLEDSEGGKDAIPLHHPEIFAAVVPGQDLLIDDGRVRVRVVGIEAAMIEAEVVTGGAVSNRKGVNLPGTLLDLSPLTEKDRADLAFGLELGVDWIALSFVQTPSDVLEARALIGDRAGIMTKVEKPQALERIEDIIRLSDAVMVARGDLGVEIPHEDVPARQKELIRACRLAVKPVVVATQMLDSMVNAPAPTRAEASDVATAIYDGADAVMLSAESATGRYPIEAVAMMDRIIRSVEGHKLYHSIIAALEPGEEETPPHAVATATATLAEAVHASAIVAYTESGTTAARVARKRPAVPILALTPNIDTSRRLSLLWGAHSVRTNDVDSYEEMTAKACHHAQDEGFAKLNDIVVVAAGIPFHTTGNTNNIRLIQI
ncbi:pyruvate kinase [Methylorubrum extorquens]|uniref:Pyruvate kinase n=3 Tax=Methylorubrum extorquens TaxID=408 RepID=C5B3N3_METEA|nr:pyruvate kinase [Methylorubrum extorquens]ACS43065.1 pyruvate kinase [Methylorubrum extorquens AM1]MCP1545899.1 pyruvate kinase [Methylorubrum extorquens]MCP1591850.1 pyruvate kinase [Methylorubrum extorquens]